MRIMLGKKIGEGCTRVVYQHAEHYDLVVKVEKGVEGFSNIAEWVAWQKVRHTDKSHWFAPCEMLGIDGRYLVMKKTESCIIYPKEIPAMFKDVKQCNWGILNGRHVCHDYAEVRLGMIDRKLMRVTKWQ